ncbi:MAG: V-type ATP synthase subunit D [Clostridia bacterium]|nr:V-type ATP synthase subunit D [Eubacteriales bacterium]MDD3865998.1 V-type ATP synthase subunit D [Eubacteriales bacterium]MDD4461420.1 V-type ATP synthase subunit D [Eubacteriales bacterium]NCC48281.1 V-type ATP synthase subunit D [Clostridia bacterium]
MARRQINPNRMELLRLKKQLVTARRGHKLLKDKRDELMRQFLDKIKVNQQLRLRVEKLLAAANREMILARAVMQPAVLETALLTGRESLTLGIDSQNIMSVHVPLFDATFESSGMSENLPYGLATVGGELDQAISALMEAFPVMIELAEVEKTAQLLADEIEKTRRRVNSLEYILIPELMENIRSITMKMDENERGNLTRLMKVKDMIVEQAIQEARRRDQAAAAQEPAGV